MPSAIISKQMVMAHVSDITKYLTTDPSRFSRMVGGKGQSLGSFEGRIAGIKKLCGERWFVDLAPQFCSEVLRFVGYVEAGKPIWSEIYPQKAKYHLLHLDSWAGRTTHKIEILKETPKRYRVRLLEDCLKGKAGRILLVPKYAVTEETR